MKICSVEGCEKKRRAKGYCEKHYTRLRRHQDVNFTAMPNHGTGARKSPSYSSWIGMVERCYDPKFDSYIYYGARGITVCDRWRFGENGKSPFECFLDDMGEKPTPKHSIDRKDTNGNYEPSNCRWATPTQQIHNRRKGRNNTSGYIGVHWNKQCSKWEVRAKLNSKPQYLGFFKNKIEAAKTYDRWVMGNRGENATTNFCRDSYLD